MKVVLAPDKFKGTLTAAEAAAALASGWRRSRPTDELTLLPVADGGEGTLAAALASGYQRVDLVAAGPTGVPAPTAYAVRHNEAVVELAAVVGSLRLPEGRLAPLTSTTCGLGEVIRHALARGARHLVVGLGGSASTDGGAGLLTALGARLLDRAGAPLLPGGAALADLVSADLDPVRIARGDATFVLAADVDNPLLGPAGAAAVFGPQKGAGPDDIARLERGLERWSAMVTELTGHDDRDRPGAGAAGGTGYGALALLGATVRSGADAVLDLIGFDAVVAAADLVITGEGRLDPSSLGGKAPVGVARRAGTFGVPVVAVVGQDALDGAAAQAAGFTAVHALPLLDRDLTTARQRAASLVSAVAEQISGQWAT